MIGLPSLLVKYTFARQRSAVGSPSDSRDIIPGFDTRLRKYVHKVPVLVNRLFLPVGVEHVTPSMRGKYLVH